MSVFGRISTSCAKVVYATYIVYSASSLITFISALAVFLVLIASILESDYWIVKKRNFDVPGLYHRHGRYRYQFGVDWRSVIAFLVAVTPTLPGLANSVTSSVGISTGLARFYDCNYLYSFF
jgi:NCS1 family nucleobase:cation symporter-1